MRGCTFAGAGRRRPAGELLLGLGAQPLPVGEELLVEQREQQVLGIDLGIPAPARQLLRSRDGLLALDRQPVEIHRSDHSSSLSFGYGRVAGGCGGR